VFKFLSSIDDVQEQQWDGLWDTDYPFIQHRFLRLLEQTGCTCLESGWQPQHLVYMENGELQAALVLFLKHHSYGEYVFDWGWADAYERSGFEYYPKLLSAIPFTPATGPRFVISSGLDAADAASLSEKLFQFLQQHLQAESLSSFHLLFPNRQNRELLSFTQLCERQGCQFHWFNHSYTDFEHFLDSFNSRKRKAVRRERRKVQEEGITLHMRCAKEVVEQDWKLFFALYHRTYLKRSGRPGYLSEAFFLQLAEAFPDQVLLCCAYVEEQMIAGALYFRDAQTLYGRYWGAMEEHDGLHFETCYYQGIEYAIAQGIERFDPGAQGEHKIQRGFVPVKTCSFHYMLHPGFNDAVKNFVGEEQQQNQSYVNDGRNYLPFKEGVEPVNCECLLKAE